MNKKFYLIFSTIVCHTCLVSSAGAMLLYDLKPKVDFATGRNPVNVAIADLDGDGKPEMVALNKDDNTVSVYRNISSAGTISVGSFAAKVDYATLSGPRAVAIGDLDGDGKPDLIITNDADGAVSILRNKTQPGGITASSFADQVDFTASASPADVAVGDLDGDGKLDFAVVNTFNNSIFLYHNIISVPGAITQSSFEPPVVINLALGTVPVSIAIGDLDGDGKPELVITNRNSDTNPSLSVFRNTASVGSLSVNSFPANVDFAVPSNASCIAISDLDGDGKPDLISTDYATAQLSIFRNTATPGTINAGSFAPRVDTRTAARPRKVVIGDFNGDQRPDLAVIGEAATNMSVFLNISSKGSISTNSFAPRADYTAGSGHFSLATGDLDGDGKADLVVANGGVNNPINTLSVFRSELQPKVYYVTPRGTGDGSSWLNSSGNLQAMINAASPHDEIWVAAGTYQPTANTSFSMVEGVGIYGGFAGTESSRSERNRNTNVTTLQGNGSTVVVSNNVSNLTVLDGFTITGGNLPTGHGGGISNQNSSPVLSNLIISGNNANDGAGISNDNSSPQIVNCLIIKNNATWAAGIFNFNSSSPVITNCTITANIASQQGGGINNAQGTNSIINNSILYGNKDSGGYLYTMNMRTEYRANTTVNYSLVEGASTPGTGNIFGDPLFTNETAGDYSLQSGSPAINAGDPETNTAGYAVQVGNTDLAGNMRVQAGQVDMGAFESSFTPVIPVINITPDNNSILYVNSAVPDGDHSGNSWGNAIPELADALKWAKQHASSWTAAPLQIWVAKGTYKPLYSPFDGDDDKDNTRYNAFQMVANVEVYGGFAGTESDRNQRNWQRNVTILSGDRGVPHDNSDNTYKVVIAVNNMGTATLDGFTVTGGNADNNIANGTVYGWLGYNYSGGGMVILGSALEVANCIISGNRAMDYGGGVYNVANDASQHPTFMNCLFTGNIAGRSGGAIMNDGQAWCHIYNCTIVSNQAEWDGGGLYQLDNPELTILSNSIIWGNSAGGNSQSESASYYYWGEQPNFSYSIVANMSQSGSNLVADPLFVNAANGDYSLMKGSPAVDAGDPQTNNEGYALQAGARDLAGNVRIQADQIDMGAYELPYHATPTVQASGITFVDTKNTSTGINWTNGNGEGRAVFMAATENGTPVLVNGSAYEANSAFGTADTQLDGSDWYCIYNDIGHTTPVTGLLPNTVYRVMVVEYNGSGTDLLYNLTTATDNPANVTTLKTDQTITIGTPIADKTYGDPDFDISDVATASSGLPVVYSIVSGPATISNNIITITGAGTVTLAADQPGNNEFNAAPQHTTGFIVNKATATLALSNLTQTYDGTAKAVTVTTTPTGLGSSVTVTYDGSATAPTDAGTYAVVAGLDNPNYTAADVTGTLTITPATITGITLADATFTYDGQPHSLSVADLPQDATVKYTGNDQTNAGTYTVTAVVSQTNHDDLTLTAQLVINRAVAVITADLYQSFVYGGQDKFATGELNHNETQLIYTPQQSYVDVGVYPITISAAQTQNYEAASVTVTFEILPAQFHGISLADGSFTYDGTVKSLAVAGAPADATVKYTGNDQTDAGSYTVTAVVSKPNFEDLTLTANLVINRAVAVLSADREQVFTYDGTPKSVIATLNHSESTLAYDPQQRYTDAGTYSITVRAAQSQNYEAAFIRVTLVIKPATIAGVTLADGTFTYDGSVKSLAVAGLPQDATVAYTGNDQVNAGDYTVTATIKQQNYVDKVLTADLIINRAQAVITADPVQTFVYDGTPKSVIATLNHSESPLTYDPQQSYTDAGTYRITIRAAQSRNHEAASRIMALRITGVRTPVITWYPPAAITYGTALSSVELNGTADVKGSFTYAPAAGTSLPAGSHTLKVTFIPDNAAYATVSKEVMLTVNKAESRILGETTQLFIYDGKPKELAVRLNHPESDPVYLPARFYTDAGTYTVSVSAPETRNYRAASRTFTLRVEPAWRSLEFPGLPDKVYGDADFDAGAVSSSEGEVIYSSSDPAVATVSAAGRMHITGAGIATITATVPANANYENRPEVSQVLTVGKAKQTITLSVPPEVRWDAGSVEIPVSATSGLPVVLSVDDPLVATVEGTALHIHRLGTVRITATQAGDANHEPAEPVTATVRVADPSAKLPVKVHPAVSPNGDGINEFLIIEGIRDYPENKVTLFSRNGTIIYSAENYDNDRVAFRGVGTSEKKLPAGTYFYLVEVQVNGKMAYEKGYFVLAY
ncbi:FG-GAP-like repeat-containing protein [Parapedobacter koreensis]|nr:FG-GAP-like repeat-containing protein [Parapedobacter koreensis]